MKKIGLFLVGLCLSFGVLAQVVGRVEVLEVEDYPHRILLVS